MPDTAASQAAFPQLPSQRPGVGFPIARLVVVFSLAVGTAIDAALGPFLGEGNGEQALFRALHGCLGAGDVLLADRGFSSYWELAAALSRGADAVCRMHQSRSCDFRFGRRLGSEDHVVEWPRPPRPDWMDKAAHAAMPRALSVREVRVRAGRPGFRTRVLVVATTLLDAATYSRDDLAALYRARWAAELDLRDLKVTLHMDVLRGKTPAMVRKEVWAHLLGYNLLRGLMAGAASGAGLPASALSFKGALQAVTAFAPVLWSARAAEVGALIRRLREAIARHRVGGRPDRFEPRERKRRPKPYPWLKEPRAARRSRLAAESCG